MAGRDDADWRIGAIARELAEVREQLDEHLPKLRTRGHDISNALQPITLRVQNIEATVRPLAEEVAAVKAIRISLDSELTAMKSLVRAVKWTGGVFGSLLIALGIWIVTTTWDLQGESEDHGEKIGDIRESQRAIRDDATTTRSAVAALGVRIEAKDARDSERWDRVREALERLEKRRGR